MKLEELQNRIYMWLLSAGLFLQSNPPVSILPALQQCVFVHKREGNQKSDHFLCPQADHSPIDRIGFLLIKHVLLGLILAPGIMGIVAYRYTLAETLASSTWSVDSTFTQNYLLNVAWREEPPLGTRDLPLLSNNHC